MKLTKETNTLNFTSRKIYSFISNVYNFEKILGDDIKDFTILDNEKFSAKIGSLPKINLKLELYDNQEKVKLVSSNPKMDFSFEFFVEKIDNSKSKIKMDFLGNFSSMIEMMVKNPMDKFTQEIISKLDKIDFN